MGQQKSPVPKNWPDTIIYLTTPAYSSRLNKAQLQAIRVNDISNNEDLPEIPRDLKPGPCALVKITPINNPQHPACGQAGLCATRALPPGSLIMPYLGELHPSSASSHSQSDYDLWLSRTADVAVDAARMGNEARFVNDYRGVPGQSRPNAEFREVWDARRGEMTMAVFVLPAGKKAAAKGGSAAGGIAKGEEILVSYGKGFWGKRKEEDEATNQDVRL